MPDYEQAVFISYAWGEENEVIVNQLDEALQGRGIKIIRDKRDLEYTGSIKNFMERIGAGDCVIVVISDKYLKSPNCMFELVEIAGNKQFGKRIFPVVLADANIYNWKGQLQYIKHWETQIKELNESLEGVGRAHLTGIYEQLDLYDRIRDNVSKLTAILSDMNALTPEMHKASDFTQLYTAIEKRIKESPASSASGALAVEFDREDFEPETILIPEGSFSMGSDAGEGIKEYDTPRHKVSLPAYR
ncbi:MAG TPA: TIR domain-containing protein, partial [Anaerolineales bacterium]|nr:TIR domain-containing protein [Anaerolineales bacterium]